MRIAPLRALLPLLFALLFGCAAPEQQTGRPELRLEPVAFSELPGWRDDRLDEALPAIRRSCTAWSRRDPETGLSEDPRFGTIGDWQRLCAELERREPRGAELRRFLEEWLVPYRATDRGRAEGLFTGYFEPLLNGSRTRDARFRYPIYRPPPELVTVDLGRFAPDLKGRRIAGRVSNGRLVPLPDRRAIDRGALAGRGLEILWVDDPIALFFLHIQGSGQVRLRDGTRIRVGYAAQNGHPYRAIGRELIERGAILKQEMSLPAIRKWLESHPREAASLLWSNPSYVFFRELKDLADDEGPIGSLGVPLTAGRSLAVDPSHLPLGIPLWLDTTAPWPEGERPLRRLVMAQDTGGAIKGPVRGDLFWGAGSLAAYLAGHMKQKGQLYLLLPRRSVPAS